MITNLLCLWAQLALLSCHFFSLRLWEEDSGALSTTSSSLLELDEPALPLSSPDPWADASSRSLSGSKSEPPDVMCPKGGSSMTLVAADLAFLEGGGGMVCTERCKGKEQAVGILKIWLSYLFGIHQKIWLSAINSANSYKLNLSYFLSIFFV